MIVVFSGIIPVAYAEVIDLSTTSSTYFSGDDILFSGAVEKDSTGLVTIVIRDSNDDFVLLTQAMIDPDDTFEHMVKANAKFSTYGVYNATAFIFNMTSGAMTSFDFSKDRIPIIDDISKETPLVQTQNDDSNKTNLIDSNIPTMTAEINPEPKLADFVDPTKDPQHYVDRYYNEPAYKSWFDTNYPNLTIEEATGYEEPTVPLEVVDTPVLEEVVNDVSIEEFEEKNDILPEEILPDAEALSITSTSESVDSSGTIEIALAIGGLCILTGAVYGVKRKVDNNTEQISQNRATIKKKLLGTILSNDPLKVIQDRLAKGEISVEEYNQLRKTLHE